MGWLDEWSDPPDWLSQWNLATVPNPAHVAYIAQAPNSIVNLGATTRTIPSVGGNIPGVAVGDLLVTLIANGGSTSEANPITAPDALWTRIRRDVGVDTQLHVQAWWGVATATTGTGSGSGVWTFGPAGSAELISMVTLVFRADAGRVWTVDDSGATITNAFVFHASQAFTAPSVSPVGLGSHLLLDWFVSTDVGGTLPGEWNTPAAMTARYVYGTNSVPIALQSTNTGADSQLITAGATGTRASTFACPTARSTDQIAQAFAFSAT